MPARAAQWRRRVAEGPGTGTGGAAGAPGAALGSGGCRTRAGRELAARRRAIKTVCDFRAALCLYVFSQLKLPCREAYTTN